MELIDLIVRLFLTILGLITLFSFIYFVTELNINQYKNKYGESKIYRFTYSDKEYFYAKVLVGKLFSIPIYLKFYSIHADWDDTFWIYEKELKYDLKRRYENSKSQTSTKMLKKGLKKSSKKSTKI